ncbi:fimbria/pilus outer membrane usher protein [Candidatus Njordibacter sp. Uisw_002]|uniref:fimbria/pilus outer membrane usher protein n=1 Tax=Candidatus Njordibacter sp. Uisw_002 TaxID=3230971 RepID=UPI003D5648A6
MRLDVYQAGMVAHKINAITYLNARLLLLTILTLTPLAALAEDPVHDVDEVFMAVLINEQTQGTVVILRSDGRLFAGAQDLRRWRLRLPNTAPLTQYGEDFFALDALAGLSYRFDESSQVLTVQAPPSLFDATRLKGTVTNFSAPTPASLGGFLNYDVTASHRAGETNTGGALELGGFGSWGTAQTRILALDLNRQARAVRLDTTWTRDQPMQMASLLLGDGISGTSSWGGAIRFGGVQWATNFSTQPGVTSFPVPGMSGEAALPSTVDLYVDNALRMSREVPSGPFSIQDLPVRAGQGDARLVLTDILGREQIITLPFYATPRLLKQGLQDYSYELGFVRRNFGTDSNNYGRALAVGTHRLGITDQFTAEIHGELLDHQQSLGLGGVLMLPAAGVLSGSFAASHSDKGVGGLLALGLQRQGQPFSFGVNTQFASQRFVKLGMQPEALAPRHISRVFVNLATSGHGSFTANYTEQAFRDRQGIKILAGSYSRKIGSLGNLSASVTRPLTEDAKTTFNLNFSMPLGNQTNASISTSAQPGREQARLAVSHSMPAGSGVGYHLVAGAGDSDYRQAEVSAQNEVGTYTLGASQISGQTAFRGSAGGAVAFLGGSAFLSRRITNSFAVVQVPGYSGVGVYADNQLVARTDANGSALLPRLRPYQKNTVRIEQADLPLDAQIDAVQLDAVPYFRSGLLLKFPVKRSRGALFTVVLDNGDPLPAGAQAQIIGDNVEQNEVFPTGLRGEVYLTGLAVSNRLRVTWREQSCEFVLPFPESTDPLPHLGTYICTGVEP